MNAKLEKLKKGLITSAIKSGGFVLVCSAVFLGSYYLYVNSQENIKILESKDRQLRSEINQLRDRNERLSKTLQLYQKLVQDSSLRSLELNRKNISTLLNDLGQKYLISNVSITIDPVSERHGGIFDSKTGTIVTSQIKLNFDATSDVYAFAFIDELLEKFSGYLNHRNFTIHRNGQITEEVLRSLLSEGKTRFINANLSFDWLGLRPKLETEGSTEPSPEEPLP